MRGNVKIFIICFLTIVTLGLLPEKADAFSLQIRGGAWGGILGKEESVDYFQGGLDFFIYEGRNLDLFVGAGYTDLTGKTSISFEDLPGDIHPHYSVEIRAGTFGIRLKPATRGRWKPYFSLGGIVGSVDYEVSQANNQYTGNRLLTTSSDSITFSSIMAGLGMDIGLGTRLSLVIEANMRGAPTFKMVFGNTTTGEVEETQLLDGGNTMFVMDLGLGLKYSF